MVVNETLWRPVQSTGDSAESDQTQWSVISDDSNTRDPGLLVLMHMYKCNLQASIIISLICHSTTKYSEISYRSNYRYQKDKVQLWNGKWASWYLMN